MDFHVWDFPEHTDVRFNRNFINQIRNMTVEKEIHHPGDKRRRPFAYKKQVKLIAYAIGQPYHKIAERLYPEHEWHGKGRNRTPHKPFINIKQFLTVHQVTGMSLEEMERNIIAVRNSHASTVEIPMKFPVVPNQDWAWLFGFWFSSGGLITRHRVGKNGYPSIEKSLRFTVDMEVFTTLLTPILKRMVYVPKPSPRWYISKGIKHQLDKGRRKGVGGVPRKTFTLVRPVREIAEKFGLPCEHISQKQRGGKYASRKFRLKIPQWITKDSNNLHSFIEGYINGSTVGSCFHVTPRGYLRRTVEIRFGGWTRKEVEAFRSVFVKHFNRLGITGSLHDISHRLTSKLVWLGYIIFSHKSLTLLHENFNIRRPDVRARLMLEYFMDTLLYKACQELTSAEILILGAIIEKPRTILELYELFRMETPPIENICRKLENLGLIFLDKEKFCFDPEPYRQHRSIEIEDNLSGQFREPTDEEISFLKNLREVSQ